MSFVTFTSELASALRWSRELQARVDGEHPQAVKALEYVGDRAWNDVTVDALQASKQGWQRVSFWTVLMRKQARGAGKIKDERDVEARRQRIYPLQDTGGGFKVMPDDVRTGWLGAPGQAADFAQALIAALSLDDTAYRAMSARARQFSQYMFSPRSIALATRAVYASLLSRDS